ncbi:hypothetical protein ACE6H2_023136 [Prunus campanulata]
MAAAKPVLGKYYREPKKSGPLPLHLLGKTHQAEEQLTSMFSKRLTDLYDLFVKKRISMRSLTRRLMIINSILSWEQQIEVFDA